MIKKIRQADIDSLQLVCYPDPRLQEVCTAVENPADPAVRALVERMFEVMAASRGVGLAAPQVGVTARLFIASPTGEPEDRRVYINPEIVRASGSQDGDEGCLSFPGIYCKVKRHDTVVLRAADLEGNVAEHEGQELLARIFEHESDHLEGRLLVDRMSSVARMKHRRSLKELQTRYTQAAS